MNKRQMMTATAAPTIALLGFAGAAGAQTNFVDVTSGSNPNVTVNTTPDGGVRSAELSTAAAVAAGQCGIASSNHKYSASALGITVDVFKHNVKHQVCENNTVITGVYNYDNECKKYGWGVLYGLSTGFSKGPVGEKTSWGRSTCRVRMGGSIGAGPISVDISYARESQIRHNYSMKNGGVVYSVEERLVTV